MGQFYPVVKRNVSVKLFGQQEDQTQVTYADDLCDLFQSVSCICKNSIQVFLTGI